MAPPLWLVQDFVALARANPGKLSYGSPGSGSSPHIATVMLARAAGLPPFASLALLRAEARSAEAAAAFLREAAQLAAPLFVVLGESWCANCTSVASVL